MEGIKVTGSVALKVICVKTGKILSTDTAHNLVVNLGKKQICNLLGGSGIPVSKFAVGEGTAAPALTDTALTNQFIKDITAVTYPTDNKVQFSISLDSTEANGLTITELGLFTNTNEMFARKVRSPIIKTSAIIITGIWTITIN